MLLFEVFDDDTLTSDDLVAFYGLPLSSCMAGFRRVPLNDHLGEPLDVASLFIQIRYI